jgi:hypothetical protein
MDLGLHQYQLLFDALGLGILLAIAPCILALVWHIHRRRIRVAAVLAAVAGSLAGLQIYRGLMVPDRVWPAMLGAIENSAEPQQTLRVQDLQQYWRHETMRAADWYIVSRRWGVCHLLWSQNNCLTSVPSEKAVGVAREILDGLSTSKLVTVAPR